MSTSIRIATRGSRLALVQAGTVADLLQVLRPDVSIELVVVRSDGDQARAMPIAAPGFFTKALDAALLAGEADIAVHSLKDLPTDLAEGVMLAAVPEREDPRDAFVGKSARRMADLRPGDSVGTSSPRRAALLAARYPGVCAAPIRGNVDTRMRSLETSDSLAGLLLAVAGLKRLGLLDNAMELLDPVDWPPAPGQGALAVTCRADDARAQGLRARLNHGPSQMAVTAERAFLSAMGGGCRRPIGAYGRLEGGILLLTGMDAASEAAPLIRETIRGSAEQAERIGYDLAHAIRSRAANAEGST